MYINTFQYKPEHVDCRLCTKYRGKSMVSSFSSPDWLNFFMRWAWETEGVACSLSMVSTHPAQREGAGVQNETGGHQAARSKDGFNFAE